MEYFPNVLYDNGTWSSVEVKDSEVYLELNAQTVIENKGTKRKKNSFVWTYFHPLQNLKQYTCIICNSRVGPQTSNLARHLFGVHNITRANRSSSKCSVQRGRPSRSFIWKYCTKEDTRHARCHFCQKILYFGCGNTANIAKHLHRRHLDYIDLIEKGVSTKGMNKNYKNSNSSAQERKERKGGSYVWKYCKKLSRHTICCNLCNKNMSFHGTANVITHLQRKHNIIGKSDVDTSVPLKLDIALDENRITEETAQSSVEPQTSDDQKVNLHTIYKRRRRSGVSTSIVWKYCTRISTDVALCSICNKNLSYQGTSNLQRHLHRMHGVVTQGRVLKTDEDANSNAYKQLSSDFVWQYCVDVDNQHVKCTMCTNVFERRCVDDIMRHLTQIHHAEPQNRRLTHNYSFEESDSNKEDADDEGFDNDAEQVNVKSNKYQDTAQLEDFDEFATKKGLNAFSDIIVEEKTITDDEDPFENTSIQQSNPLSPASSHDAFNYLEPTMQKHNIYMNKKLQKLTEARLRMETEYFREKTAFYRNQKYLTTLQAQKLRLELAQLKQLVPNRVVFEHTNDSNVSYTLNGEKQNTHTLITQ